MKNKPSNKLIRSRAINGVLFVLHGVASNINIQRLLLTSHGSFSTAISHLALARLNIMDAIDAIKRER